MSSSCTTDLCTLCIPLVPSFSPQHLVSFSSKKEDIEMLCGSTFSKTRAANVHVFQSRRTKAIQCFLNFLENPSLFGHGPGGQYKKRDKKAHVPSLQVCTVVYVKPSSHSSPSLHESCKKSKLLKNKAERRISSASASFPNRLPSNVCPVLRLSPQTYNNLTLFRGIFGFT